MSFLRRRRRGADAEPVAAPAENEPVEGDAPDGEGEIVPDEEPAASRPLAGEGEAPEGEAPEGEAPEEEKIGVRESVRQVRRALAPVGARQIVMATLGITGLLVVGTLLFSGFSFWWTSQPSFCDRCHVMKPYVAAWKESPHQEVSCESCHLTPGVFGFVGGKIAGLQVVMNYIRGQYEDYSFNAAVSNASCLQCHGSIMEANIHRDGIRVSHANIIGMGGKCLSCHSTVAHGDAIAVGSATHPSMSVCLQCHNDKIAPLKCDLCHVGRGSGPVPEGTIPASPVAAEG